MLDTFECARVLAGTQRQHFLRNPLRGRMGRRLLPVSLGVGACVMLLILLAVLGVFKRWLVVQGNGFSYSAVAVPRAHS